MINHVLLEVYCFKDSAELKSDDPPVFCPLNREGPGFDCLSSGCPFFSFTSCENSLCYVNENSEAEEIISFGGEMEEGFPDEATSLALWKKISSEKIDEAYEYFMSEKVQEAESESDIDLK